MNDVCSRMCMHMCHIVWKVRAAAKQLGLMSTQMINTVLQTSVESCHSVLSLM